MKTRHVGPDRRNGGVPAPSSFQSSSGPSAMSEVLNPCAFYAPADGWTTWGVACPSTLSRMMEDSPAQVFMSTGLPGSTGLQHPGPRVFIALRSLLSVMKAQKGSLPFFHPSTGLQGHLSARKGEVPSTCRPVLMKSSQVAVEIAFMTMMQTAVPRSTDHLFFHPSAGARSAQGMWDFIISAERDGTEDTIMRGTRRTGRHRDWPTSQPGRP